MPMISWKRILSLFFFFMPILALCFFLRSSLYFNLLRNQNGPSYFYLSYDWLKKAQIGAERLNSSSTAYLGSSRTAYTFDNTFVDSNTFNLSLMAASYTEINLLIEAMLANKVKIKRAYLELNPTSATLRHMKSMSPQAAEKLFNPYFSTGALKKVKSFFLKNSIYMNHLILRDYISHLLSHQYDDFDNYKRFKRNFHVREFQEMTSPSYQGFLSPVEMPQEFYARSFSECSTMLNWIMAEDKNDDLDNGRKLFSNLIESLKKISSEVIVWIPPSPPSKRPAYREKNITQELIHIAEAQGLKVKDLRSGNNYQDSDFFDCVHPNSLGARKIRSTLLKN